MIRQIKHKPSTKRRVATNTPIITQISHKRQDNQQKCHREVETKNVTEYNSNNATLSVFVRKRPVRKEESEDVDAIQTLDFSDHGKVLVYQSKRRLDGLGEIVKTTPFSFDGVFGEQDTTGEVYKRTVGNLIPELFVGRSVSVIGYGQNGTGKTYTMMGSETELGLYQLAAKHLFRVANSVENCHTSISMSFFEIRNSTLFDLLSSSKCKEIIDVIDVRRVLVKTPEEVTIRVRNGQAKQSSCPSHVILQMTLQKGGHDYSKLIFTDLAGSGCADIYNSLSASNVLRKNKLTQVLKSSWISDINARTIICFHIEPGMRNCNQTLQSLRTAASFKRRDPKTGELCPADAMKTRFHPVPRLLGSKR